MPKARRCSASSVKSRLLRVPRLCIVLKRFQGKGCIIKWTGNVRSIFWSRDCGTEALVGISQRIFDCLGKGDESYPAENHGERKHVTVKPAGPNLVELRYQGKVVQLRGSLRVLFLYLFWHRDRAVPFKELWTNCTRRRPERITSPTRREVLLRVCVERRQISTRLSVESSADRKGVRTGSSPILAAATGSTFLRLIGKRLWAVSTTRC